MPKLYIIGPLPPPIGGVGIYLERFIEQNKDNYDIKLLDYSKLNKFRQLLALIYILIWPFKSTIFVNHINILIFLSLLLRPFSNYLIYYDHNFRFMERLNSIGKKIFKSFLIKTNEIQIVNNSIINYFSNYGLDISSKAKLKIPFLPPIVQQEESLIQSYPKAVKDILLEKNIIITANAFRLELYQNIDLYGGDLCIEITKLLKKRFQNFKFVFFVSKIMEPYHQKFEEIIKSYNLMDNFYLITGNYQFWPILKHCDLFIRPTYTDGDSISVREAIYFNTPVIASDAVIRPTEVVLFKNRDVNDLFAKVLVTISSEIKIKKN